MGIERQQSRDLADGDSADLAESIRCPQRLDQSQPHPCRQRFQATNHVECPSKERHLRKILAVTSAIQARADVAYCIHALAK